MGTAHLASNMNFPAPLAVVGFLAAIGILFLALSAVLIFWFARKPKFARIAAISIGAVSVVYFSLLFGFSAGSHETALARGQEKYFCEIDCHLAYSIVDVNAGATPLRRHPAHPLRRNHHFAQSPQRRVPSAIPARSPSHRQRRPRVRARRDRRHSAQHASKTRRLLHHETGIQSSTGSHRPPSPDQHHPRLARQVGHRRRKQPPPQKNLPRLVAQK